MARIRKLNYNDLDNIIQKWKAEQQEIDALYKQTKSKVESLHNNQWIGEGSEKFFNEMETQVLPAMSKLVNALGHAADVTVKIKQTIQQRDEETKGFFGGLI